MMKYFNLNYPGLKLIGDHTVRKEVTYTTLQGFLFQKALIRHFILHPDPMVVPVYHFEVLENQPSTSGGSYGRFTYAYEMMRLGMLENDEKRIIEKAGSFRWMGHIPDSELKLERKGYTKLIEFMEKVISMGRYDDIHGGNFLKDNDGDYRIIDLEGFDGFRPLEDPRNNWITR